MAAANTYCGPLHESLAMLLHSAGGSKVLQPSGQSHAVGQGDMRRSSPYRSMPALGSSRCDAGSYLHKAMPLYQHLPLDDESGRTAYRRCESELTLTACACVWLSDAIES